MKLKLAMFSLLVLAAGIAALNADPVRDLNLQIEVFKSELLHIYWNDDPMASRYRVYVSGTPLPPNDPGWLYWTETFIPTTYFPLSPQRAFFCVSSVYDDLGTLTYIPGGTFNNGSSNVTISSFYLDRYEVTQGSYQEVMNVNPAHNYGVGDNFPVYFVDWFDAVEYCNRRSIQEGIAPCYSYLSYGTNPDAWPVGWNSTFTNHANVSCDWSATGYRLATEMEWMFAAKGGNLSHNYTYSGSNDIGAVAWYNFNSGNTSHVVGGKAPNELGLYDMSGNLREWVWDIAGPYPAEDQTDPTGPLTGTYRDKRGGYWGDVAASCTVFNRSSNIAENTHQNGGFRICRSVP